MGFNDDFNTLINDIDADKEERAAQVDPLVSRSAAKLSEKAWRVGFACSRLLETLSADERQRVARQLLRSADEAED